MGIVNGIVTADPNEIAAMLRARTGKCEKRDLVCLQKIVARGTKELKALAHHSGIGKGAGSNEATGIENVIGEVQKLMSQTPS